MSEEAARELESWLNREFRGYGFFVVEAEEMCAGGWKVTIT